MPRVKQPSTVNSPLQMLERSSSGPATCRFSERTGESTNRRQPSRFRQKPTVTPSPSYSLSLEGEGWGEGGCLGPQPCRGPSNPPRSTRLFKCLNGVRLAPLPVASERAGEATNARPRGRFRPRPKMTPSPSFSLSLEGEGWGEGGCLGSQPFRGSSNPSRSTRLFSFQSGACLASLRVALKRVGESTNRRPRGRFWQEPTATPSPSFSVSLERPLQTVPRAPSLARSCSLSLEGEGWGEGGCLGPQPCPGSSNPPHSPRLFVRVD